MVSGTLDAIGEKKARIGAMNSTSGIGTAALGGGKIHVASEHVHTAEES